MASTASSSNPSSAKYAGTKRRLKIWLLFVTLFMGWALYTLFNQLDHQGQAESKLTAEKQKVNDMIKLSDDLKLELKRLNDPEYIGLKATQDFGMVKSGERKIEVSEQP